MVEWSVEDRGPGRAAYLRQQEAIDKANREYDRQHGTNRYAEHQAAEHKKFVAWQDEERARRRAARAAQGGCGVVTLMMLLVSWLIAARRRH